MSGSNTPTHISDSFSEYSYELLPHTNIIQYKLKTKTQQNITDTAPPPAKAMEDVPTEDDKIPDGKRKIGDAEYESSSSSSSQKKGKGKGKGKDKDKDKDKPAATHRSFQGEFPWLCYLSEYAEHPKFIQDKYLMMGSETAHKLDTAWTDITFAELELHLERLRMMKKALKYYFK